MAAWIRDLAAQRQAFREKIEERQGLMVPSEDPDWDDLGEAFPSLAGAQQGYDLAAAQAADHPLGEDPSARPGRDTEPEAAD